MEAADTDTEDFHVVQNEDGVMMEKLDILTKKDSAAMEAVTLVPLIGISTESEAIRQKSIPHPGSGQRIYEIDPPLRNHHEHLDYRYIYIYIYISVSR